MGTLVVTRSPRLQSIGTIGDPGPAPNLPHELKALFEGKKVSSVTISAPCVVTDEADQSYASRSALHNIDAQARYPTEIPELETIPATDCALGQPVACQQHESSAPSATIAAVSLRPTDQILPNGISFTACLPLGWASLTIDEKQRCCGSKCPNKRLGKNAWFVTGQLRDTYFKGLEKIIKRVVDANHKKIFRQSNSGLTFSPVLLGSSDDINKAEPTILLLTGDIRLGQRAQNTILRSAQYSKYGKDFRVEVDHRPVLHPAMSEMSTTVRSQTNAAASDLCPRTALIRRVPAPGTNATESFALTRITIGGTLLIRGGLSALIVAHCLLDDYGDEDLGDGSFGPFNKHAPAHDHMSMSDDDPDSDSEEPFVDIDSDDEENSGASSDEFVSPILSANAGFDVYADSAPNVTSIRSTEATNLKLLGRINPIDFDDARLGSVRRFSFENDWALISLLGASSLRRMNGIWIPGAGLTLIKHVNRNHHEYPQALYVAAGVSGVLRASIVEPCTSYAFPWAKRVRTAFTLNVAIQQGDSGAWIVDENGNLYGIAVATVPSLSITYALRAEDVFTDIALRYGLSSKLTDIDSFLPTSSDERASFSPLQRLSDNNAMKVERPGDPTTESVEVPTIRRSFESDESAGFARISGYKLYALVCGLVLVTFALSLDMSIVPVALPTITSKLGSLDDMGWYVSANLVCMTALQPLVREIFCNSNDTLVFFAFVAIFEAGCLLSGFARSPNTLIAGRALAGIGGSGFLFGVTSLLRSRVTEQVQLVASALLGLASWGGHVTGHMAAGSLIQQFGWPWCFWINPPIGAAAILILALTPRHNTRGQYRRKSPFGFIQRLDIIGYFLFSASVVTLLLLLQWGGDRYAWNSAKMVVFYVISPTAFTLFIVWELLLRPNRAWVNGAIFCWNGVRCDFLTCTVGTGAFYVINYYLQLWFQVVRGMSSIHSAVCTLPVILTPILTDAAVNGFIYKIKVRAPVTIGCMALSAVGAGLLCTFEPETSPGKYIGCQLLASAGLGLVAQRARLTTWRELDGVQGKAIFSYLLAGQLLGGAVFFMLAQTVFIHSLRIALSRYAPEIDVAEIMRASAIVFIDLQARDAGEAKGGLKTAYNHAITQTWFVAVACLAVATFSSLGANWKHLRKRARVGNIEA